MTQSQREAVIKVLRETADSLKIDKSIVNKIEVQCWTTEGYGVGFCVSDIKPGDLDKVD